MTTSKMPLYQVIVLALIQAITEFLPISSTAHLALAPWLFGWKDPGLTFDIALHAGTLLAILVYFLRDWIQIIAEGFGIQAGYDPQLRQNRALLWLLAVGSIPIGAAGLLFNKQAETTWRSPYVIGAMLILVGVLMWLAERAANGKKDLGQIQWGDGISIGVAQALAVVPGTSRSGITITAGLFRSLTREAAARFSFLLATPAIAAAAAKDLWDLRKHGGISPEMRLPFALGAAISAIGGIVVIAYFLKYLRRRSLMPFVYYRIAFGIIVIALAAFFRFSAE
jgi:undecaprenyl-diphosphatase